MYTHVTTAIAIVKIVVPNEPSKFIRGVATIAPIAPPPLFIVPNLYASLTTSSKVALPDIFNLEN